MERLDMNTKVHDHKRHGHRQPNMFELYELEHRPYELMRAPSAGARPQSRHVLISDDYYDNTEGIEAKPYWRPMERANGVIFRPEYNETAQPYRRRYDEGDCKGDINCEAEMFIRLEHHKFEQTKWDSIKK